MAAGKYFQKWQEDGVDVIGVGSIVTLVAGGDFEMRAIYSDKILLIKDTEGNPLSYKQFNVYSVENNAPSLTETKVDSYTSDGQGKIYIPGRRYLNRNVGTGGIPCSFRTVCAASQPSSFQIQLVRRQRGHRGQRRRLLINVYNESAEQIITLDHTLLRLNLIVSIEWDATGMYWHYFMLGFRDMSDYLYDVTDGTGQIGYCQDL